MNENIDSIRSRVDAPDLARLAQDMRRVKTCWTVNPGCRGDQEVFVVCKETGSKVIALKCDDNPERNLALLSDGHGVGARALMVS